MSAHDRSSTKNRPYSITSSARASRAVIVGNLLAQLLDRCGVAEAVDHEIGAPSGKRARNSESNPARRTGNDSHLVLRHEVAPYGYGKSPKRFWIAADGWV
jgi:ribosomal protein L37E